MNAGIQSYSAQSPAYHAARSPRQSLVLVGTWRRDTGVGSKAAQEAGIG